MADLAAAAIRTDVTAVATVAMTSGASRANGTVARSWTWIGGRPMDTRASICEPASPEAIAAAATGGRRQTLSAANAAAVEALASVTPSENGASSKVKSPAPLMDISSSPWLAATPRPSTAPGPTTHSTPRQRAKAAKVHVAAAIESASAASTPGAESVRWVGKLRATKGCSQTTSPSAAPRLAARDQAWRGDRGAAAASAKILRHATRQAANEIAVGASAAMDRDASINSPSVTIRRGHRPSIEVVNESLKRGGARRVVRRMRVLVARPPDSLRSVGQGLT